MLPVHAVSVFLNSWEGKDVSCGAFFPPLCGFFKSDE